MLIAILNICKYCHQSKAKTVLQVYDISAAAQPRRFYLNIGLNFKYR